MFGEYIPDARDILPECRGSTSIRSCCRTTLEEKVKIFLSHYVTYESFGFEMLYRQKQIRKFGMIYNFSQSMKNAKRL